MSQIEQLPYTLVQSTKETLLLLSSHTSWVCNGQNSQLQFVAFFRHPAMLTCGERWKHLSNLVEFLNLSQGFWLGDSGDSPHCHELISGELRSFFFGRQIENSMRSYPVAPATSGHDCEEAMTVEHFLTFHVIYWNGIRFHQSVTLTKSQVIFFGQSFTKLEQFGKVALADL